MDSQKQIRVQRAGTCHPVAQRDILVGTTGHLDPKTVRCDQLTRHVLRRGIDDVLFIDAVPADRSGVDPAMAGVEDDQRPIVQRPPSSQRRLSPPRRLRQSRLKNQAGCSAARQQTQQIAPAASDIPHAPTPDSPPSSPNKSGQLVYIMLSVRDEARFCWRQDRRKRVMGGAANPETSARSPRAAGLSSVAPSRRSPRSPGPSRWR